jgi:thiamine pyrophosphate-dependent acetolactate synthase large subunit-like protein
MVAMGGSGAMVDRAADLDSALLHAIATDGPMVIDVRVANAGSAPEMAMLNAP